MGLLLKKHKPDAYEKFAAVALKAPAAAARISTAAPAAAPAAALPFNAGDAVFAMYVADGLWYKAVVDSVVAAGPVSGPRPFQPRS